MSLFGGDKPKAPPPPPPPPTDTDAQVQAEKAKAAELQRRKRGRQSTLLAGGYRGEGLGTAGTLGGRDDGPGAGDGGMTARLTGQDTAVTPMGAGRRLVASATPRQAPVMRRRSRPPLWWLVKHAAGREARAKADTVRRSVPRQRVYA